MENGSMGGGDGGSSASAAINISPAAPAVGTTIAAVPGTSIPPTTGNNEANLENTATTSGNEIQKQSRRIQLLRKRLAITMLNSNVVALTTRNSTLTRNTKGRTQRQLRSSRGAPNVVKASSRTATVKGIRKRRGAGCVVEKSSPSATIAAVAAESNDIVGNENSNVDGGLDNLNHRQHDLLSQIDSNMCPSLSSAANSNDIVNAAPSSNVDGGLDNFNHGQHNNIINSFALSPTFDLTMCSSSSSAASIGSSSSMTQAHGGNASAAAASFAAYYNAVTRSYTIFSSTTCGGAAIGNNSSSSMLQPTTTTTSISSSSDPVPDVVFQPNDFSSILAKSPSGRGQGRGSRRGRGSSGYGDASASSSGNSSGVRTSDPEQLKGLFSPSPQVFEEDTRMSADLSLSMSTSTQSTMMEPPVILQQRQLDFLNNEESQSSVVSNTSILDVSLGAPRPKKLKMEVCVAEDMENNNEESQSSVVSNTSILDVSLGGAPPSKRPKKLKMEVCVAEEREEERAACFDLQTFIINRPLAPNMPSATLATRPIVEAIEESAQAENIPVPPFVHGEAGNIVENTDYASPLALVPGQFSANYRHYTPLELSCSAPTTTTTANSSYESWTSDSDRNSTSSSSEDSESDDDGSSTPSCGGSVSS